MLLDADDDNDERGDNLLNGLLTQPKHSYAYVIMMIMVVMIFPHEVKSMGAEEEGALYIILWKASFDFPFIYC